MPARVLHGNPIRDQILAELRGAVEALSARGARPGLAAVLVGNNPASETYVRNKIKACQTLGLYSEKITPPETATTGELIELVQDLNRRDEIHGILVQMPLPPQVDSKRLLVAIDPAKDVDGLHPYNAGCLLTGRDGLFPCTPCGVLEILKRSQIPIAGQRAVVIGRSDLVGKPVALLLMHEHATVTICHSKTQGLAAVAREADILVAALGKAAMVTRGFIRPGATVIDVGISRVERDGKSTLVGDVNAADAAEVAGAYTPVPGGVGPLTVAMLMANTVKAAQMRRGSGGA